MLVVENLAHRYAGVPVLQIANGMPGVVAVSARCDSSFLLGVLTVLTLPQPCRKDDRYA